MFETLNDENKIYGVDYNVVEYNDIVKLYSDYIDIVKVYKEEE